MRLLSQQMSFKKRLCQEEFVNLILAIREDRDINNDIIQWSLNDILPKNTSRSLVNSIYSTLVDSNMPLSMTQHLAKRVILTTRNDTIDNLNAQLLTSMTSELFIFYNIDILINDSRVETMH